jgi:LAS superfamily LD-carboxypeptidase LdcB
MPRGRIPGSLGSTVTSGVVVATAGSLGGAAPERTREQFKQAVLAGQIRRKERQGKKHFAPVPDGELEVVEAGFKMRKAGAQSCRELLRAARAALAEAQKTADALAKRTTAIGIASAYRDYVQDSRAWSNTFEKHYEKPENRTRMEAMSGGRHGDAALEWFIALMSPIKAPPGFSNHSNGLAVDFSTTDGGVHLGPNTNQRAAWRASWLHPWLVANAATYRFHALASEEWHWDWA